MSESLFVCYDFKVEPLNPGCEILIAQLSQLGFDSFQENNDGISAYIDSTILSSVHVEDIQILNSIEFDISFEFYNVKKQNWNIKWESNFEPIYVDKICCVRAPFHKKSNYKYDLVIEPKMSFGTGHHETTSMMISFILANSFSNSSVCDIGSGTGVLAILAEKRGASKIDAIDIDNWCYLNSIENIERNNSKNVNVYEGEVHKLMQFTYDNIFANINLNVLLVDIPIYSKMLNTGGLLYLSGFYLRDINSIEKVAKSSNLSLVESKVKNQWVALKFAKTNR
ncbi:50S ribosomal protein L11 methyltransferase [Flavobacteriaceae bacterium]|jgi:ribosomal protein L11 methyltransferase|nr:50S ribosomal protein L11 methyltransferase [Flavobacteriaceae bacterium]MDC1310465.1 50S ribosomal protein L11 methyltransferase [Flavobacteriaceae bacterium]